MAEEPKARLVTGFKVVQFEGKPLAVTVDVEGAERKPRLDEIYLMCTEVAESIKRTMIAEEVLKKLQQFAQAPKVVVPGNIVDFKKPPQ